MTSVKYDFNFLAGFVNDDEHIEFNSYSLGLHLFLNTENPTDQQTAFARLDTVIYDVVDNCVFIEEGHLKIQKQLAKAGIMCLTVSEPGPSDQVVQITLVDKLNAVAEGVLHIFESEMSSTRGGMVKYIYHSVGDDPEEYTLIGTDPRKWWTDPNPRFSELAKKTTDIHNIKDTKTWKKYDLEWEEDADTDIIIDESLVKFGEKDVTNIITMNIEDFPKDES